MKIENMAIIFAVILLILLVGLSIYYDSQIKTLNLQISYDSKLQAVTNATLLAFKNNTANNTTSDIVDTKLTNIEACVNVFYQSMESNYGKAGYTRENLKEFVPAIVFTMYDGYYIYSPYSNVAKIVDQRDTNGNITGGELIVNENENSNVQYGIKPYIYYSCRYQFNGNDFIITYSLDNYITIRGKIGGEYKEDAGYILTGTYDYLTSEEELKESIIIPGVNYDKPKEYSYTKINGTKYYLDGNEIFYILNGRRIVQTSQSSNLELFNKYKTLIENPIVFAKKYYTDAYSFTQKILNTYGLRNLTADCARDENGNQLYTDNYKIFDTTNTQIEYSNSNFNRHRQAVIRHTVETNLATAISGFNNYSDSSVNFQMPVLNETEWDKIANNVCVISFLQGLSLGTRTYNGYCVLTNRETKEVVQPEDIYIITSNDGEYHDVICEKLKTEYTADNISRGVLDLDETKKYVLTDTEEFSFFPQSHLACYYCVMGLTGNSYDDIYSYLNSIGNNTANTKLKRVFYTTLGREREAMFKMENVNINKLINDLLDQL